MACNRPSVHRVGGNAVDGCKSTVVREGGSTEVTKQGGGTRVCVATRLDAAFILPGEEERRMANFLEYNPEQAYLLPPTVRAVLGEGHLCFFVHGAVEKLDLQSLKRAIATKGIRPILRHCC